MLLEGINWYPQSIFITTPHPKIIKIVILLILLMHNLRQIDGPRALQFLAYLKHAQG